MFVALVIMALLTSMSSGYFMKILLPKDIIVSNEPEGVVVMGDNALGMFVARYLSNQKIPVLLVDSSKDKLGISKIDNIPFQANILKKGVIERLDLSRYGMFIAISENDDENEKGCKIFHQEFGENHVFRLITKKESQSSIFSLPENILFRGLHWHFGAIEKIITKNDEIQISEISFDSEASLNKFISFNNNKKQIIPLFIRKGKRKIIPISSQALSIEAGNKLLYIDIPKQAPKSVKPKLNNIQKVKVVLEK
jgi:Trk K+ transport system NAD-binding subunit